MPLPAIYKEEDHHVKRGGKRGRKREVEAHAVNRLNTPVDGENLDTGDLGDPLFWFGQGLKHFVDSCTLMTKNGHLKIYPGSGHRGGVIPYVLLFLDIAMCSKRFTT